jgi:PAS domain S-box-containing protein
MDKQHLLESIVESASQGIVAVDRGGRILFANQAAAAMFGYTVPELVGSEMEILLPQQAAG